jgi:hypothetical protein
VRRDLDHAAHQKALHRPGETGQARAIELHPHLPAAPVLEFYRALAEALSAGLPGGRHRQFDEPGFISPGRLSGPPACSCWRRFNPCSPGAVPAR